MEQDKIAKFITECRKEKGLTQAQLAEKLGVSNKSISKWENARCMPDLSLFEPICNEFGITITELLSGERLSKEKKVEEMDKKMFIILKNVLKRIMTILKILVLFIFFLILLFIIYIALEHYKSQKIYLKSEDFKVSLCEGEGYFSSYINIDVIANDGYSVLKDIVIDETNNSIYIKAYRERRDYKHPELMSNFQGAVLINKKKNTNYKIYINSDILYDENMKLEKCTYD